MKNIEKRSNVFEVFEKNTSFYSKSEDRLIRKWYQDLKKRDNLSRVFTIRGELLSLGQIKVIKKCFPDMSAKLIKSHFEQNDWIENLSENRANRNNLWMLANSMSNVLNKEERAKIYELSLDQSSNDEQETNDKATVACVRRLPMTNLPHFDSYLKSTKGLEGTDIPGAKIYVFDRNTDKLLDTVDLDPKETAITLNRAQEILESIKDQKDVYIDRYIQETGLEIDNEDRDKMFNVEIKSYFYAKILKRKLFQFAVEKKNVLDGLKYQNVDVEGFFRQKFTTGLNQKQQEILKNGNMLRDFFMEKLGLQQDKTNEAKKPNLKDAISGDDEIEIDVEKEDFDYQTSKRKKNGNGNGKKRNGIPDRRKLSFDMERARRSGKPWPRELCEKYIELEVENNPMVLEHFISLYFLEQKGILKNVDSILSLASGPHEEYRSFSSLAGKKNLAYPKFVNIDFSHGMLALSREQMQNSELKSDLEKCIDITGSVKEWPIKAKFDMIECSSWDSIFKYDKTDNENLRVFFGNIMQSLNAGGVLKFALDKKLNPEFVELLKKAGFEILIANSRFKLSDKDLDLKISGRKHYWLIAQKVNEGINLDEFQNILSKTDVFMRVEKAETVKEIEIDTTKETESGEDVFGLFKRSYENGSEEKDIPMFMMIVKDPGRFLNKAGFEDEFLIHAMQQIVGKVDIEMAKKIFDKYLSDCGLHKYLLPILDIVESTGRPEKIINLELLKSGNQEIVNKVWNWMMDQPDLYLEKVCHHNLNLELVEKFLTSINWQDPKTISRLEKMIKQKIGEIEFEKYLQIIFENLADGAKINLPVGMRFGQFAWAYFKFSNEKPKDENDFSKNEISEIFRIGGIEEKLTVMNLAMNMAKQDEDQYLLSEIVSTLSDAGQKTHEYVQSNLKKINIFLTEYLKKLEKGDRDYLKILELVKKHSKNPEQIARLEKRIEEATIHKAFSQLLDKFSQRGKKINKREIGRELSLLLQDNQKLARWIVDNYRYSYYASLNKSDQVINTILEILKETGNDPYVIHKVEANALIPDRTNWRADYKREEKIIENLQRNLQRDDLDYFTKELIVENLLESNFVRYSRLEGILKTDIRFLDNEKILGYILKNDTNPKVVLGWLDTPEKMKMLEKIECQGSSWCLIEKMDLTQDQLALLELLSKRYLSRDNYHTLLQKYPNLVEKNEQIVRQIFTSSYNCMFSFAKDWIDSKERLYQVLALNDENADELAIKKINLLADEEVVEVVSKMLLNETVKINLIRDLVLDKPHLLKNDLIAQKMLEHANRDILNFFREKYNSEEEIFKLVSYNDVDGARIALEKIDFLTDDGKTNLILMIIENGFDGGWRIANVIDEVIKNNESMLDEPSILDWAVRRNDEELDDMIIQRGITPEQTREYLASSNHGYLGMGLKTIDQLPDEKEKLITEIILRDHDMLYCQALRDAIATDIRLLDNPVILKFVVDTMDMQSTLVKWVGVDIEKAMKVIELDNEDNAKEKTEKIYEVLSDDKSKWDFIEKYHENKIHSLDEEIAYNLAYESINSEQEVLALLDNTNKHLIKIGFKKIDLLGEKKIGFVKKTINGCQNPSINTDDIIPIVKGNPSMCDDDQIMEFVCNSSWGWNISDTIEKLIESPERLKKVIDINSDEGWVNDVILSKIDLSSDINDKITVLNKVRWGGNLSKIGKVLKENPEIMKDENILEKAMKFCKDTALTWLCENKKELSFNRWHFVKHKDKFFIKSYDNDQIFLFLTNNYNEDVQNYLLETGFEEKYRLRIKERTNKKEEKYLVGEIVPKRWEIGERFEASVCEIVKASYAKHPIGLRITSPCEAFLSWQNMSEMMKEKVNNDTIDDDDLKFEIVEQKKNSIIVKQV